MRKHLLLLMVFGAVCIQAASTQAQTPTVVQPVITPPPPDAPAPPAVATPVAPTPVAPAPTAPALAAPAPGPPIRPETIPKSPRPSAAQPIWWRTSLQHDSYDGETQNFGLRPTATIRVNNYEAPTPTRIIGARTITTPQLRDMLASADPPLLIDVLGGNPQDSLPGAILFTQAGLGNSYGDQVQQHLAAHLAQLTHGNLRAPMVFFCLSKTCWLSHNAAVRAVSLGYTNVVWYRGGRDAWIAAGLPMEPATPAPF